MRERETERERRGREGDAESVWKKSESAKRSKKH